MGNGMRQETIDKCKQVETKIKSGVAVKKAASQAKLSVQTYYTRKKSAPKPTRKAKQPTPNAPYSHTTDDFKDVLILNLLTQMSKEQITIALRTMSPNR